MTTSQAAAVEDVAAAASAYADAGLHVLPTWWPDGDRCACPAGATCPSPGKHPLTPHGKDDATSDVTAIAAWWRRWPRANIGLRPAGGLVVLDVDPRAGGATALLALTRAHGALNATWAARTGGAGLHAWYRYGGPLRAQLCPGVDLKGHGGYVLAPPSLHASGRRYQWITDQPVAPLPGWTRRILNPPAPPRPAPRPAATEPCRDADAGLVRVVAEAQEGGRNAALHWAACRAHERGADPQLLADIEAAALAVGLPAREVTQTIRSAANTARGPAA